MTGRIARPMLVPVVGDWLSGWTQPRRPAPGEPEWVADDDGAVIASFTPVAPQRTGMFTPVEAVSAGDSLADANRRQARADYAAEMNSEEMEQHLTERLPAASPPSAAVGSADPSGLNQAAARLEASAAALPVLLGQLKVSGSGDVASVLGDVVRGLRLERSQSGLPPTGGADHLTVSDRMARAVGLTPVEGLPPVRDNLTRFGLFTDQALRLGVSGDQAERVVREVQAAPDGRLSVDTRAALVEQARTEGGLSHDAAHEQVNRLEHSAQRLPNEITAVGLMAIPAPQVEVQPQIDVQPHIDVQPQIEVQPQAQVEVTVTAAPADADAYYEAMQREAALGGSGGVLGGGN